MVLRSSPAYRASRAGTVATSRMRASVRSRSASAAATTAPMAARMVAVNGSSAGRVATVASKRGEASLSSTTSSLVGK